VAGLEGADIDQLRTLARTITQAADPWIDLHAGRRIGQRSAKRARVVGGHGYRLGRACLPAQLT
jgi:hypothetical protein